MIFFMSSQPAEQSSATSDGLADKVISVVYPEFEKLSDTEQVDITNNVTHVIRKAAHFLEYFVLGILAFLVAISYGKHKVFIYGFTSWIFCVLYAFGDELHQKFVPGRACRVWDIVIDSAGGLTAIFLFALIFRKSVNSHEKNQVNKMRKKDLIQQNLTLFETLQKTKLELNDLRKQLDDYSEQVKSLKDQLAKTEEPKPVVTEPMRRLEEKIITNAMIKPDVEYGSKVIGQIVVAAAEYSNSLTLGGDSTHKELINLILGKTEIAKAEILSITETADSFEVKCAKMDQIAAVTKEYFQSVVAQIV